MKRLALVFVGFVLVMFLFSCATPKVDAAYPFGFQGYYPFLNGFGNPAYASGRVPTPPYFAIHPPVYYSQPVARTYGYSPFAYPGTMQTPEIIVEEPAVIENPYVEPASDSSSRDDDKGKKVASVQPMMIHNPFVDQSAGPDHVQVAKNRAADE